jgi:hypothetical protein
LTAHPELITSFDAGWQALPQYAKGWWLNPIDPIDDEDMEPETWISWAYFMYQRDDCLWEVDEPDQFLEERIIHYLPHEGFMLDLPEEVEASGEIGHLRDPKLDIWGPSTLRRRIAHKIVDALRSRLQQEMEEIILARIEEEGVGFLKNLVRKRHHNEISLFDAIRGPGIGTSESEN